MSAPTAEGEHSLPARRRKQTNPKSPKEMPSCPARGLGERRNPVVDSVRTISLRKCAGKAGGRKARTRPSECLKRLTRRIKGSAAPSRSARRRASTPQETRRHGSAGLERVPVGSDACGAGGAKVGGFTFSLTFSWWRVQSFPQVGFSRAAQLLEGPRAVHLSRHSAQVRGVAQRGSAHFRD